MEEVVPEAARTMGDGKTRFPSAAWRSWSEGLLGELERLRGTNRTTSSAQDAESRLKQMFADMPSMLGEEEEGRVLVPASKVITPNPDGDGMIDTSGGGGVTTSTTTSSSSTTTTSPFAAYASAEWCEWFGKLSADGRAQVEAAILAVDVAGAEEEQDEAADRSDAAAFLLLHFGVSVVVLADYFLAQEWPKGEFVCQWAYITSTVMYKPFTVPMWSCLLPLCSYTFAELLFGGCKGGRDEATGTPLSLIHI